MIDYEALILERQENIEIWEDEPDSPYLNQHFDSGNWWDEIPPEVMYDYCGEDGNEERNIREEFEGSWTELQEHIKQMRKNGCYNITAAEVRA